MILAQFNIISSVVTFDDEGNPFNTISEIILRGHCEISSVKTITIDESVIYAKKLTIRITDENSIKKLKTIENPIKVICKNTNYTISEVREYQTYIEIICQ